MAIGLLGRKVGMTQVFNEAGMAIPVTVIQAGPCHVLQLRTADRDGLRAKLDMAGIQTGIHYPVPVHLQPAYAGMGYRLGDFPESERAANQVLSLPMFAELTDEQIDAVAAALTL